MKDEEVSKLLEKEKEYTVKIDQLAEKLNMFLSKHKGRWFTPEELSKELGANLSEIYDAYIKLKYKTLNYLLGRFEAKYLSRTPFFLYRKKW